MNFKKILFLIPCAFVLSACTTDALKDFTKHVIVANSNLDWDCQNNLIEMINSVRAKKGQLTDNEFRKILGDFCVKCKNDQAISNEQLAYYLKERGYGYKPSPKIIEEWRRCYKYNMAMRGSTLQNNIIKELPSCKIYYDEQEKSLADKWTKIYKDNLVAQKKKEIEAQKKIKREKQLKEEGRVEVNNADVYVSGKIEFFEKDAGPVSVTNLPAKIVNQFGDQLIIQLNYEGNAELFVVDKSQIKYQ